MEMKNSILEDIREGVGLTRESQDFDADLIMHINGAIGELGQNGITKFIVVTGTGQTWGDLQDPLAVEENKHFQMVPLFITLSTRLIFDPPPPSMVDYYTSTIHKLLWRLKVFYEGIGNTPKTEP